MQQTERKDSEPCTLLETSVPPPGEGHGANQKGASHLKPCYFYGCPRPITPARSKSEVTFFSVFTTTAHLGLLSLRVTFPLTDLYFYLFLLAFCQEFSNFYPQMAIQRVGPTNHLESYCPSVTPLP